MAEDQVFVFDALEKQPRIHFSNFVNYRYFKYPTNQLTKSKNALDDLPLAIKYSSKIFASSPSRFLAIGIVKQLLSAIKFCSNMKKIDALKEVLKLSLLRPQFFVYIPTSISTILRKK